MKVKLMLIDEEDNPNNASHREYFEEVKSQMEDFLSDYATHGILPDIEDDIDGTHEDGSVSNYQVILRSFSKDHIQLAVKWI